MGKSNKSSSSTSSTNQDNRIANEDGNVVGAGAVQNITNTIDDNVVDLVTGVFSFGENLAEGAKSAVDDALQANEKVVEKALNNSQTSINQANLGNASLIKDLAPLAVIGILGISALQIFRKK